MAQAETRTKRITAGAVVGTAVMLMGLTMPACPGQQEAEKKIQDMGAKVALVEKSVSSTNERIRALENEISDLKKALTEVAEVLKTHKTSIDEMTTKVSELSARSSAPAKKAGRRR